MTIYDVFYEFLITLFPVDVVNDYLSVFELIAVVVTLSFTFWVLKLIKKAFVFFK